MDNTPATDAIAHPFRQRNDQTYTAMLVHARKLERQRDELRDGLQTLVTEVAALVSDGTLPQSALQHPSMVKAQAALSKSGAA